MGDEADALWDAEMIEEGRESAQPPTAQCDQWPSCACGYSWDGIRDDRIADKGFKPWCFDGLGHKRFQGGKEDLRDIVREILAVR